MKNNIFDQYNEDWKNFDNALAVMSLGDFRNLFNPKTYEWQDCPKNGIPDFIKWLGYKKKTGEVKSWINSWREMYKVLKDKNDFSDNCWIILEYRINPTNKRVDFILCGKDKNDVRKIIIIELKQWDKKFIKGPESRRKIKLSNKDYKPQLHPSLQALGYKSLIKSYNKFVNDSSILIKSCAYLHNFKENMNNLNWINGLYENDIKNSPLYTNPSDLKNKFLLKKDYKNCSPKNNIEYDNLKSSEDVAKKFLESKVIHKDLINMFYPDEQFYLVDEQAIIASQIIDAISIDDDIKKVMIVHGGPGSGKSAIALAVYKYLKENTEHKNLKVKIPITTNSFRECLKSRLNNNLKEDIIATKELDVVDDYYDVLICDEAHRLKDFEANQHWDYGQVQKIITFGKNCIFFVDDEQLIVEADEGSLMNIIKVASQLNRQENSIPFWTLTDQYRCNGSNEYINWIDKVLKLDNALHLLPKQIAVDEECNWKKYNFDFKVCSSTEEMICKLHSLPNDWDIRLLTGQNWDKRVVPLSKRINFIDKCQIDLDDKSDTWAIDKHKFDQFGTVHAVQGMEFDYVGVVIGEDLESLDTYAKRIYKILLTRGTKGCYVYCCDSNLNQRFKDCMPVSQGK